MKTLEIEMAQKGYGKAYIVTDPSFIVDPVWPPFLCYDHFVEVFGYHSNRIKLVVSDTENDGISITFDGVNVHLGAFNHHQLPWSAYMLLLKEFGRNTNLWVRVENI